MRRLLILLLLAACTSTTGPLPATPPWREPALGRSEIPSAYATEWQKAANRETCALIAPRSVGAQGAAATPRAATFAGGWAVAYDLPDLRSAFGVAGAGVKAGHPSYDKWPNVQEWNDGSSVGYGPEGGVGPNHLAYLRIAGQDCLYNIWSHLGREHLETLISELRMVK